MRKPIVLSLLTILSIAIAAAAAPMIDVDDPVYDFGRLFGVSAVTHAFIISNLGDEPLSILDIRTSCICTTTALSKSDLAPGESVELEATVDLTNFSGHVNQTISVSSNDLANRRLKLRITGEVTPAQPYHIAIQNMNVLFYLLIDLRDPEAYASGHLAGAINIPYWELENWSSRLPREALTIVLYDQDGTLSDLAAQKLSTQGFDIVRSLLGGLGEWKRQFGDMYLFPFEQYHP